MVRKSILSKKIIKKEAKVGVIGTGYVGLPLMIETAKAGFKVIGLDKDAKRIEKINKGQSYIFDISSQTLKKLAKQEKISATADFSILDDLDIINICVPTPLDKNREPDISPIVEASQEIKKHLHPNQLIILESTTYPGTTEEIILPILQESKLRVGRDFYLAFSPERIDPGNKKYNTHNTPKVIGGVTEKCLQTAVLYLEKIVENVVPVSSTRVAEMIKLLENIFRSVNIALVNELMVLCDKMKIDIWEVVEAAASKPFGFMSFSPGPGLGGHCIPVDPFYLSWKAQEYGFRTEFIELAGKINESMPDYVVSKISDILNSLNKSIKDSRIMIIGVAYKKDLDDVRESPGLKIIEILQKKGADVCYHDPFIPRLYFNKTHFKSNPLTPPLLRNCDCVVLVTGHSNIDYETIVKESPLIIDTRNILKDFNDNNIFRI